MHKFVLKNNCIDQPDCRDTASNLVLSTNRQWMITALASRRPDISS